MSKTGWVLSCLRRPVRYLALFGAIFALLWRVSLLESRDALIRIEVADGKVGFINDLGVTVIEPRWEDAMSIVDVELILVKRGGKWGWVDRNDQVVIEPEWDEAGPFNTMGLACVSKDGKWGWIRQDGTVVAVQWDQIGEFGHGGVARVCKDGKWGWVDGEGAIVVPISWHDAMDFDEEGMAPVKAYGKWGWIDQSGDVVLELNWEDVKRFDARNMACTRKSGRWGWIDRTGKVVIEHLWEDHLVDSPASDYLAVKKPGEGWGWIARTGDERIPFEWDSTGGRNDCSNRQTLTAQVHSNIDVWEYFYKGLRTIIIKHEIVRKREPQGWIASVKRDWSWGWADDEGRVVVSPEWELVMPFNSAGIGGVCSNGSFGLIDCAGQVQVQPQWSHLFYLDEGERMAICSEGKWGLIDGHGNTLVPPQYSLFKPISGASMVCFLKDDQADWVDSTGNVVFSLSEKWEDITSPEIRLRNDNPKLIELNEPAGYVAVGDSETGWMRSLLVAIESWIGWRERPATDGRVCLCFDGEGRLIWSSAKISVETKSALLLICCAFLFVFLSQGGNPKRAAGTGNAG